MTESILFVCQLNMVRSPIAEGLAREKGFQATSCGLDPGEADDLVTAIMREVEIDVSAHEPQSLHAVSDQKFDRIVTFSEDTKEAALAIFGQDAAVEMWPVPTPSTGSHDVRAIMDTYRAIRTIISNRLDRIR